MFSPQPTRSRLVPARSSSSRSLDLEQPNQPRLALLERDNVEDAEPPAGPEQDLLARLQEERLSMHALRHSFASLLATDRELPATTLAQLIGHTDAGFTLRVYARDTATVVADVLVRAETAGVGSLVSAGVAYRPSASG